MEGIVSFTVEQTAGFLEDRVGVIVPALQWDIEPVAGLESGQGRESLEAPGSGG